MDELGIIITQNGEKLSFGEWKPREIRDGDKEENYYHDSCFKKNVYPTQWFQNLNIPYDLNKGFHNQLDVFAKNGIVVLVNNKQEGKGSIVLAAPNTITDEQIQIMFDMKDNLISFEDGNFSFIDILDIDEDYSVLDSFYHISDYYDYLEKLLDERKSTKK